MSFWKAGLAVSAMFRNAWPELDRHVHQRTQVVTRITDDREHLLDHRRINCINYLVDILTDHVSKILDCH